MTGRNDNQMLKYNNDQNIQSLKSSPQKQKNWRMHQKVFKLFYGNQIALINEKIKKLIHSKVEGLAKAPRELKRENSIELLLNLKRNSSNDDVFVPKENESKMQVQSLIENQQYLELFSKENAKNQEIKSFEKEVNNNSQEPHKTQKQFIYFPKINSCTFKYEIKDQITNKYKNEKFIKYQLLDPNHNITNFIYFSKRKANHISTINNQQISNGQKSINRIHSNSSVDYIQNKDANKQVYNELQHKILFGLPSLPNAQDTQISSSLTYGQRMQEMLMKKVRLKFGSFYQKQNQLQQLANYLLNFK